MYGSTNPILLIGAALGLVLLVVLVLALGGIDKDAVRATQEAEQARIALAIASGTITYDMTRRQVLAVWGEPDDVESRSLLTTLWVYRNPFRTVTFDSAGAVVDYLK